MFSKRPEPSEPENDRPVFQGDTQLLLANAVAFDRLRVEDVMVPRADIIAVEVDTPLKDLAALFSDASHSRLPIFRETLDDPIGIVHIKDVVRYLAGDDQGHRPADWGSHKLLPEVRRPLLYAPPSMRATDLLLRMQTLRQHMALVVDEFGGTDGLVTLEDLLEPIVGEIQDEHDDSVTPSIKLASAGCWDVDARVNIDDFEALVAQEIASEDEGDDVDTLGGLVFMLAGRIPERGEVIRHPSGFEFEVTECDPRRIKRLRIRQTDPDPEPSLAGK